MIVGYFTHEYARLDQVWLAKKRENKITTHQDECQQVYFGGVFGCDTFVCYRGWSCDWYVV